jgi:hypothetical protein
MKYGRCLNIANYYLPDNRLGFIDESSKRKFGAFFYLIINAYKFKTHKTQKNL